jgi:Na+-translocating ferredoxin:NAD+ oxidoreductase RnfE subunit
MNQYEHPWGAHSPLMSLTGIALIIASSSRLSSAILVFFVLAAIHIITLAIMYAGKPIIPEKYKTAITIMLVTFITSLFYLVVSMIHPVSAWELELVIFLIPITFLSSHLERKDHQFSPGEEIMIGAKQSVILGGIIVVIALIREPLGYGTLSLPFSNKTMNFMPEAIRERAVLHVFAAPFGGFLITACLIALVQSIFNQQDSASAPRMEDFND